MITVYEDISNLIDENDYKYIISFSDYVVQYSSIKKAIKLKKNETVVVRNPAVFSWLKSMAKRFPNDEFKFNIVNFSTRLEDIWGIKIPENYDSKDLKELDLINLDAVPNPKDTFEDFILSYFFDPAFAHKKFHPSLVSQIITTYDSSIWKDNLNKNLLRRVFSERIQQWVNNISDEKEKEFVNDLTFNTCEVINDLMRFKLLRNYENIGALLMKDKFSYLKRLNLNLRHLKMEPSKLQREIEHILIDLKSMPVESPEQINSLINKVSGLLKEEYIFIKDLLIKKPELVSRKLISKLKGVFSEIFNEIDKDLDSLYNLIKPAKPTPLSETADFETVKDWLLSSYFPYINWIVLNDFYDEEIYEIGDSFSLWFYKNWEDIKTNSNRLVSNWLFNHSNYFNKNDKINIVVIIDNFAWYHVNILKKALQNKGIMNRGSEPYFSMIPSITEISKKCLLSGKMEFSTIDQSKYEKILDNGWVPYFQENKFIYLPNANRLSETELKLGQSYFINYLPLDEALHKDEDSLGAGRSEQIEFLISNLIKKITETVEEKNLMDDVVIHFISDHGSAKFSQEAKNDLDVKYFKELFTSNISHRFIELKDDEFSKLTDNLKHDAFFIDKNRFGLEENYICPRRSNTFLNYNAGSFLHGGLLPEEIVVPSLTFEYVEFEINELLINLINDSFRYKSEIIEFELANPNETPVEDIQIRILNSNINATPHTLEWLDTKSKKTISIRARFNKTNNAADANNLSVETKFNANNRFYEFKYKFKINMTSMVSLRDTSFFDI